MVSSVNYQTTARHIEWQPLVALGVAVLAGIVFIGIRMVVPATSPGDESAYWFAAERLRSGEPLYTTAVSDPESLYRYAPWLAWLWMPLTLLPQPIAYFVWEGLLLACGLYIIVTLARMGPAGMVLAALALPLIGAVESGNAGTIMVALLMWRRADPWSVGIAASLKVYPLLLCAGYIAQRRWRDCIIAVTVAAVLWAPALLYGLSGYPTEGRREALLWLAIPAVLAVAAMALARTRWTWVAVAAALPVALPHGVGIEYLWVAARRLHQPKQRNEEVR